MTRICILDGCEKNAPTTFLCYMHYKRKQLYGDPHFRKVIKNDTEARFWEKVEKTETCWTWIAYKTELGYGHFTLGKRRAGLAHRYSYVLHNGPIPEGKFIDHICHNPSCVRPDHLRAATPKQNAENRSGLDADNTSGVRGVRWVPESRKWRGTVCHFGAKHHVGLFVSKETAEFAVIAKRNELFTHNELDRIKKKAA